MNDILMNAGAHGFLVYAFKLSVTLLLNIQWFMAFEKSSFE
jgi:hypothetical protein